MCLRGGGDFCLGLCLWVRVGVDIFDVVGDMCDVGGGDL